ncbi:MAG: hypothetical protein WC858_02105 [Parcubacteria group bacterium]|jgi:hypothetical protein
MSEMIRIETTKGAKPEDIANFDKTARRLQEEKKIIVVRDDENFMVFQVDPNPLHLSITSCLAPKGSC